MAAARIRGRAQALDRLAVLPQHRDGAFDRLGPKRAIGVDSLAEARDAHLALDGCRLRVGALPFHVGDEQAGGVSTDVDSGDAGHRGGILLGQALRDPLADGIVTAGKEVRVVGVQALHTGARPADTTVRTGSVMIGGQRGIALGRVDRVHRAQPGRVDGGLGRAHTPIGLDSARRGVRGRDRRASNGSAWACRPRAAVRCG